MTRRNAERWVYITINQRHTLKGRLFEHGGEKPRPAGVIPIGTPFERHWRSK
jgi:hypothetical protein